MIANTNEDNYCDNLNLMKFTTIDKYNKKNISDTIFTGVGWILSKELDLYYSKNT